MSDEAFIAAARALVDAAYRCGIADTKGDHGSQLLAQEQCDAAQGRVLALYRERHCNCRPEPASELQAHPKQGT